MRTFPLCWRNQHVNTALLLSEPQIHICAHTDRKYGKSNCIINTWRRFTLTLSLCFFFAFKVQARVTSYFNKRLCCFCIALASKMSKLQSIVYYLLNDLISRLAFRRDVVAKGRAEGAPAPPLGFSGGPRMESEPRWAEGPRWPKSRRRRTKFTGVSKITSG